ncbi:PAS domain S-box protein [Thioalkalivibrio sp.]|uniref:PAS domain S-box protein n=1 Tax=Thioalkalivibrio sp. TaxID=2093813 RepID=UPI0012D6D039|nr:PAS domain S-box protein [Thioalkalivibrio sp.]TVP78391.1 MAG: PAS domain S-box protein [Thioalkalivibrio sp.]
MPNFTHETGGHERLRFDAEEQLRKGSAPPTRGWTVSADALELLHRLASNPDSAGEAVKLLHELRTHQVELDLQLGQLEANEQELGQERDRYKALFDFAPVGYFAVGLDGRVIETNLAGAELLGVARDGLVGHTVSSFLAPESRPALAGLLNELANGCSSASCEVQCAGGGGGLRRFHVIADLSASGEAILMIVSPYDRLPGV